MLHKLLRTAATITGIMVDGAAGHLKLLPNDTLYFYSVYLQAFFSIHNKPIFWSILYKVIVYRVKKRVSNLTDPLRYAINELPNWNQPAHVRYAIKKVAFG